MITDRAAVDLLGWGLAGFGAGCWLLAWWINRRDASHTAAGRHG